MMEGTGMEGCAACTHLDGGIFCEPRGACLKLAEVKVGPPLPGAARHYAEGGRYEGDSWTAGVTSYSGPHLARLRGTLGGVVTQEGKRPAGISPVDAVRLCAMNLRAAAETLECAGFPEDGLVMESARLFRRQADILAGVEKDVGTGERPTPLDG